MELTKKNSLSLEGKKRLHFFQDEKVVNDAIDSFEVVFPNENIYIVLTKSGIASKVNNHPNTFILSYQSSLLKSFINTIETFQEVICHSMWLELANIFKSVKHPNVTWVVWGADMYEVLLYRRGYNLYIDEKSLYKIRAQKIPIWLYKCLVNIRDWKTQRAFIAAIKNISTLCVGVSDYELFHSYYPEFKFKSRKDIFYYPIEKMLDSSTVNHYVSGIDIWVNNAAGYNGNHVDIFNRLSKFERIEKVHVPLSYGIGKYARYVEKEGRRLLGNKFHPMLTFIPKEDYYKRFLSSNSFIFGHLRACALGNVIIAIYLGAKVFLYKKNTLYDFFKNSGVVLYNIDEELNEDNVYSPLPEVVRQRNRTIMLDLFSYKTLLTLLKNNF